jgi:hypothetical protein
MKHLALMAVLALFMGTSSLVLAQTTAAAPVVHPKIHEVHTRIHDQMGRIKAGVKAGTLTQDQANALMATLKSVHEQMEADFNTNGNKELTDAQLAQLNQMLNSNSKLIYGEKHAGSANNSNTGNGSGTVPAAGGSSNSTAPAPNSSNSGSNSSSSAPAPSSN